MIDLALPDRFHHLTHRGRQIGWSEWGDPAGAPVLFCTGAAMSGSLGFGAAAARSLGLRLLCIDRAGLGRSAADPEKSFATWAGDVAAVLASQRILRPPAVGFSQGGPFAVALAAAGLVRSLVLVAAQDDFRHAETRRLLPEAMGGFVDAVAADAAGVEAQIAGTADAQGMWNLVIGMSGPIDRALYEGPDFAPAYRRALEEGFAQGAGGYARDLVLALGPWAAPPESIEVPVQLWYGALDESPSHSPDRGATLARRFPRCELRVVDGEGGSILWTRSGEILAAVAKDVGAPVV